MTFLQAPEFWSGCAFILVVGALITPCRRRLDQWAEKKANAIMVRQKEAENLLSKAKSLKKKYEKVYQGRFAEKRKISRATDKEIKFLETEALQQEADRTCRAEQEVAMRLKMIEENGRQDVKRKVLSQIIKQAQKQLSSKDKKEDMNALVDEACQVLERYKSLWN